MGIGLVIWCATTPGCIGIAMALVDAINSQGSTGSENQLSGNPEDAPETLPPVPQPGDDGGGEPPVPETTTCTPSPDGSSPETFRHYTNNARRAQIEAVGRIIPSPTTGRIWFTTTMYTSAALARSELALPRTPDGYFEIPHDRIVDTAGPECVPPDFDQPGGGVQYWSTHAINAVGLEWVPIGP